MQQEVHGPQQSQVCVSENIKIFKPLKYQIARKHVKNHSKEEQEQVKVVRDSGSQGRSTDTSQEGWLDTEMPPGHQQVSSGHIYY